MMTAALTTYKRTAYKKINDKLQRLWEQYNKGDTNNDQGPMPRCLRQLMFKPVYLY
jgi:hypothetical protein